MKEQMARVRPLNYNERVRMSKECLCVSLNRILSKGLLEEGDREWSRNTMSMSSWSCESVPSTRIDLESKPSSFPGIKLLENMYAF